MLERTRNIAGRQGAPVVDVRDRRVRVLGPQDLAAVTRLLARDPVAHAFVASRVHASAMVRWRLGGEIWGYFEGRSLESCVYVGANFIPVEVSSAAVPFFADEARRDGRRSSSLVGPADETAALWAEIEPHWGPARDVRSDQPLLATTHGCPVSADSLVRPVRPDELDILLPACVSMFTEEVGVSPTAIDGGRMYVARVAELIRSGRALARIVDGKVQFKAELGVVAPNVCQVQGVWVAPELRGQGLGVAGMAAVVAYSMTQVAPTVSLYVNSYNAPARATYARCGFEQVGTFMTVLF
jgi:uncharacterized protein